MENLPLFIQSINPQAIEICRILSSVGYQAYMVGGCVRDLLLGVLPKDFDICTDADPQEVMALFPKTLPTGLQHGTVTVVMGEGIENQFEVTTFRIEGEYQDGRRPQEVFFILNVEQDLARRDLTINAIAVDPISGRIVDPYDGRNDLQERVIRAVGNPNVRFQEDGLRIMRVARFAARLDYSVDGETFKGMQNNLETLKKVSRERISDELCKILMNPRPSYGLMLLQSSGALDVICPLLAGQKLPMLAHQDRIKGELETRLAFLYHQFTPDQVQEELYYLKLSNKEIKKTVFLLQLLERFYTFMEKDTCLAYKSFMATLKNHAPDPWEDTLEQFIRLTEALQHPSRSLLEKYQQETVFCKKEMEIDGDDLLAIGIKQSPEIKRILDSCYLEILRHPQHNNHSFLLDFAAEQA